MFFLKSGVKDPEDYDGIIKIQEEKIRDLDLYIKDLKLKHEQEIFSLKVFKKNKNKKIKKLKINLKKPDFFNIGRSRNKKKSSSISRKSRTVWTITSRNMKNPCESQSVKANWKS